jgi:polyisoprenoid-binding protein YceI
MKRIPRTPPKLTIVLRSLLLFCFVTTASANAAPQINIHFDSAATNIEWTLGDVLHTVHGTFKMKRGEITINPVTGAATGLIEIDAKSGESGSPARDKRMHKDVLNSAQYPLITFRPTQIRGKVDQGLRGDYLVDGIFNLEGRDHPMQMKVSVQSQGGGVEVQTHFIIPYVEWGLKDPSTFVLRVNKEVSIEVKTTATVATEQK